MTVSGDPIADVARLADKDGLENSSTLVRTWGSLPGPAPAAVHCPAGKPLSDNGKSPQGDDEMGV